MTHQLQSIEDRQLAEVSGGYFKWTIITRFNVLFQRTADLEARVAKLEARRRR